MPGTVTIVSVDSPDIHVSHYNWVTITKSNGDESFTKYAVGSSWYLFYIGDGKYVLEAQGYYNVSAPVFFKEGEGPRIQEHEENKMIASFDANIVYFYLETL